MTCFNIIFAYGCMTASVGSVQQWNRNVFLVTKDCGVLVMGNDMKWALLSVWGTRKAKLGTQGVTAGSGP